MRYFAITAKEKGQVIEAIEYLVDLVDINLTDLPTTERLRFHQFAAYSKQYSIDLIPFKRKRLHSLLDS